jgi:ribose-phosphate pyrophosphokinase
MTDSISPRGRLMLASCRSGDALATRIADVLERQEAMMPHAGAPLLVAGIDFAFSDSETCVRVDAEIGGQDVFLLQCLHDPTADRTVDQNYVAFLAAARAFREHGANHVAGVLPYLAYARQDKPTPLAREPTTAKLMADLSVAAGIDRLVTWHPHVEQIHGFYAMTPVNALALHDFFAACFDKYRGRPDVILVAPDTGAAKLVNRVATELNLQSAVAVKFRPQPEEVVVTDVMGDFDGKRVALVLDDMISSGGTIDALIRKLVADHALAEVHLAVSHNLGSDSSYHRLAELHRHGYLHSMVATNSVPQTAEMLALPFLHVYDLAEIFAHAIACIHQNLSI